MTFRLSFNLFVLLSLLPLVAHTEVFDGLAVYDLRVGQIVEGSSHVGGTQPPILLDWNNLSHLFPRDFSPNDPLFNIKSIVEAIRNQHLRQPYKDSKDLVALNAKYIKMNQAIPLSEYAKIQSGDCRIHGLITHFALKEAGIENKYAYVLIEKEYANESVKQLEDHAINLIDHKGSTYIVDSKTDRLNGYSLNRAQSSEGIHSNETFLSFAKGTCQRTKILKILNFPKVLSPEETKQITKNVVAPTNLKVLIQNIYRDGVRSVKHNGASKLPLVFAVLIFADPDTRDDWIRGFNGFFKDVRKTITSTVYQNSGTQK